VTGTFLASSAVARLAAARPDDLAIVVEGGADLAFGDWEQRSTALARGLVARGVDTGSRVALRFDAGHWADFAVAYLAVHKAGAVAVLVPSGLTAADAARIVRHSGAGGVLCSPHLSPAPSSAWTAAPDELEQGGGDPAAAPEVDPATVAELVYPLLPLSRPRPRARSHADLVSPSSLDRPGWLVHTWAPGSLAGQHALAQVLAGTGTTAATLAAISADALAALVSRLAATTCGLTPGLAAALAASAPSASTSLDSVAAVVLSGAGPGTGLAATFPRAAVLELGEPDAPPVEDAGIDPAPIGASQVGMVWHEQLAPGSFNLPCLVRRYRGALDLRAFERTMAELVRRHEPLRTTFEMTGGVPRQVVGAASPFELPVLDLSGLEPSVQDAEVTDLIAAASTEPFDLVDGPLFAPRLVRLGADDHVLVVRLHHTAFDDWSVDVFRREVTALYTAFLAGGPSPLPEPTTRFVEVSRRQRARLAGEVGDGQRAHWRARMAGAPFAVQLPLGERHQLGPGRPGAGEPVRHDLPDELARRVRALAPRLRATPFMTVLAAFQVILARRTDQDDLVLASVVAGRGATALESMIGCFTRKVLLRLRLDGDPPFADLVARTRSTVLDALAHQDLPFEEVVHETLGGPAAAHGLVPQVPIVFQGETPQRARLLLPGLEVGPFEAPASARRERHFSAAPDDEASPGQPPPVWGDGAYLGTFLILSLLESDAGLALIARGVFHRPAAQRLLEDVEAVLLEVAEAPERRLSELSAPGPSPAAAGGGDREADWLALRGLRLSRSRLEGALSTCAGVADVAVGVVDLDGEPTLSAWVVPASCPPPTPAELRTALWAALPGSPWPAAVTVVEALPRLSEGRPDIGVLPAPRPTSGSPHPEADLLAALWAEHAGRPVSPTTSYWQDFSFLRALAEARAAGLPITDEQVSRCRTPEMLAIAPPPLRR
jgi:non-ribosomal peptide synthetase component F